MNTVVDNLKEISVELKNGIENLLLNYTTIYSNNVFSSSGDHYWGSLSKEGCVVQSGIQETYQKFYHLVTILIKKQSREVQGTYYAYDMKLRQIIEQNGGTWYSAYQDALSEMSETFENLTGLLEDLQDPSDGTAVFVPDTNALMFNPELENWGFQDVSHFRIFLMPSVLSELDTLMLIHKNDDMRKKAETLIDRIKACRSHGRITEGVPLVEGKIDIIAGVVETDFEDTLPWLNINNDDDRILASFIEIIRLYPHSPVILVTRDINLQNKAEYACLQFEEPPAL